MAEIRVAKPARRGRAWLWLVPLVLLLAAGAIWMMGQRDGEATAARGDTTAATSAGVIAPPADSAATYTAPGARPAPATPAPATTDTTAPTNAGTPPR